MWSPFGAHGRRWRRTASAVSLAVVAGALVFVALNTDGDPITEVELNDGSVWVTNDKDGLIGRLNPQIQELDLGLQSPGVSFDIEQKATSLFTDSVVGADKTIVPIDVAKATGGSPTALPSGTEVAYNGGVFALRDAASGRAWVQDQDLLTTITAKSKDFVADDVVGTAVGEDGTAYLVHEDGKISTATFERGGKLSKGDAGELPAKPGDEIEATVVGSTPVVLDKTTGQLLIPGQDPVDLHESDLSHLHVQQPSADADEVVLATNTDVFRIPLGGGDPVSLRNQLRLPGAIAGDPAPPAVVAGCVYAAWADPTPGAANYLRDCPGTADDDAEALEGEIQSGAVLRFRVNRKVVVLNDTASGDSWLVQQPGHKKVSNWDSINPEKQNKPTQEQVTDKVPQQENRPPEATDDDVAARTNKASILPIVAMNDHDADGDIITIKKVQPINGPDVEPKIISGGTQLQVTLHGTEPGLARLKYTVTDGNGGEDSAEVRLTVLPNDAKDRKPQLMKDRDPRLAVGRGKTSSMYLLADYVDPDGDDLVLTDAQGAGGDVEFRPDGTVQFTDNGDGGRAKSVSYTIEDGHGETLTGKLPVDVNDAKSIPPQLIPDLKSGVANTRVLVQPLLNDRNPEGGGDLLLEKAKVRGDRTGTTLDYDAKTGTFVFAAEKARTYYIDYRASSPSGASATSFVRFDVESPPKDNRPPIAVADKAVLTPGSTTQADLLLNDIDDDGDVLVVTQVGESSIPGVKVSVVDKRVAVISSSADLAGKAATIPYTVSDGHNSSEGSLTVSQRSGTHENRSPVANKDQTTAREGSVATIPALANDSDPDGGKLQIAYVNATPDSTGEKLDIWVADDVLRFKAPKLPAGKPKVFKAIYGVKDPDGLKSDAEVMVFVVPDSAANNHPPAPTPIIERAIAGQPKVIGVDMAGADPDGDAVTFTKIISAPKRGRILDTGADWIKYEAYDGRTGTDFFQIEVRDKFGAIGVAAVRVGVVPRLGVNQSPVALDDSIVVRPDRRISVYVLSNDVDPDDDKLLIGDHLEAAKELNAHQSNGFISLDVPGLNDGKPVTSTVGYQLFDDAKESDNAMLRVEARSDAPVYAPVARDDIVELADIAGRPAGTVIDVDPLKNDLDIDGSPDQLHLLGCRADTPEGCQVVGDTLKVTLTKSDQVVVYDLGDDDKESDDTSGVIFVRGTDNIAPTVNSGAVPLGVKAGMPLPIDLGSVIVTRPGRSPSLARSVEPEAINGRVEPDPDVENRVVFTPARNYVGPASISVGVSDSKGGGDKQALESIVTIPIDVKPTTNVAPVVRNASVKVAHDGKLELDLAGLVRDINPKFSPDEMAYSLVSKQGPIDTRLSDTLLTISGNGSDGGAGEIVFSVDDREGATVQATIDVEVVASDRPLARVPTVELESKKDEKVAVDIASYAINPYADEGKSLKVHNDYAVEGASASAISKFKADGTRISFIPTGTGVVTVKFTVSDASGDPQRDVVGRIRVAVAAAPDKPTRPEVSSVEARSVVLSWREPNNNGAPITRYHIQGSNGFSTTCEATTCTLENLDPGSKYSFQVAAENKAGTGPWSDRSAAVTPNKVPGIMTPPHVDPTPTARDQQLKLSWESPENEGDEITSYVIKWNGGTKTVPPTTSTMITGLENGVSYQFSIFAVNSAGNGSESGKSDPEIPFGKPAQGEKPNVTPSEANFSPFINVDWGSPDDNGDKITKYVVYCDRCNSGKYVVEGTSKTFTAGDGIQNGVVYTFSVAALNRAGEGQRGPSDSAMPYRPADRVRNLRYITSTDDRTAKIAFEAPGDLGGLDLQYYAVEGEGLVSPTRLQSAAPGGVNLTFSDNGYHSIRVYAVTQTGRTGLVTGADERLGDVETWGPPGMPTGSSSASGYYGVRLSATRGTDNGRTVTGVEMLDEGAWVDVGHYSGGDTFPVDRGGDEACTSFRTVSDADDSRRYSAAAKVCGNSEMRSITATGDNVKVDGSGCGVIDLSGECKYRRVVVKGEGFKASSTVDLSIEGSGALGTCPTSVATNDDGDINLAAGCWFPADTRVHVTVDGVGDDMG
ncbi:Fibronectin type III domain-containing protein [Nocardioides terrae]|uniref:Fibronectin type III domain-containing protein n=1 Tax=Nocardioides terrae TaxID=574651 RepID=A0A1I1MKA0_9ACTN|nr:Ig-like domain-containing protein [Nocardioides terrae]SFC85506.1 Fibronectin type III domain-containing protein [Nocardioides terrae]